MTEERRRDYDTEVAKSFKWLGRGARSTSYIGYSDFSHFSATPFEFGANGYGGCCNYGGELLYLSAPSPKHGLVYAKGYFSPMLHASLARGQREDGGVSTFGLKLAKDRETEDHEMEDHKMEDHKTESTFHRGRLLERGCFNYRWPFHEYSLLLTGKREPKGEVGTLVLCSFIQDQVLYQVLRIQQSESTYGTSRFLPARGQLELTLRGPALFQSFFQSATTSDHQVDVKKDLEYQRSNIRIGTFSENCMQIYDINLNIGLEAVVFHYKSDGEREQLPLERLNSKGPPPCHTRCRVGVSLGPGKDKSATFVTAIRMFDTTGSAHSMPEWPDPPSSEDIFHLVAAGNSNVESTGMMWEIIFRQRYLRPDWISHLHEVNLIARSLERIVEVDIIPAIYSAESQLVSPSVLVSNLFFRPAVNFKALFWKVRFLIKVYQFLNELISSAHPELSNKASVQGAEEHDPSCHVSRENIRLELDAMIKIAAHQLKRIKERIEGVAQFLAKELDETLSSQLFLRDTSSTDGSHYYYIMIALWFVAKNFLGQDFNWGDSWSRLKKKTRSIVDEINFHISERTELPLLQWYHHESILKLVQYKRLHKTWANGDTISRSKSHDDLRVAKEKVYRLRNAALAAATAKLSSIAPYSLGDEIFDRLAFIVYELGFDDPESPCTVASLSKKRVKERQFTKSINPGWLPPHIDGYIDGPWEVHALCHHSRLMSLSLDEDDPEDWRTTQQRIEEIETYKMRLCQFVNSEATLTSCWDRSPLQARTGWLNSEASAVVASTLLDLQGIELDNRRDIQSNDGQRKLVQELTRVVDKLVPQPAVPLAIEWKETWKPPRLYHPDYFITSLDDTPELYRPPCTDSIRIPPPLRVHMTTPDKLREILPQGFTKQTIENFDELRFFHIADITDNTTNNTKITFAGLFNCQESDHKERREKLVDRLCDSLVDQDVRHRFLVVTSPQLGKDLLNILLYVLCPRSVACLSSHIMKISRFSSQNQDEWITRITITSWQSCLGTDIPGIVDSKNAKNTRISAKAFEGQSKELSSAHSVMDATPINLPTRFHELLTNERSKEGLVESCPAGQAHNKTKSREYCLQVSSFVLVTNSFGDFSKCSIISEIINEEGLKSISEKAWTVWRVFAHQPQTARCLVFFLVLGELCLRIATQYRAVIDAVSSTLNLNDFVSRRNQESTDNSRDVPQFQLGLWSLESLYKLQYSLKGTLSSILDAKVQLYAQIRDGASTRSEILQRMCQEYIDTFESNIVELNTMNTKLERDIELNARYKDAFEAVLTLTDSRTSINQNRTIQRLTYVTIGYLPAGLMAAIFAIPGDQNVILQSMGREWFIGGIFLMLVVTSIVAIYIEKVMEVLKKFKDIRGLIQQSSTHLGALRKKAGEKISNWWSIGFSRKKTKNDDSV